MPESEWLHDPVGLAALLPASFRMGVTSSALQVEGGIRDDGRTPSTWDTFMAQRGRIVDGSSAAVAADAYHRVGEDVRWLSELGVDSYRFSLGWPRLQPDGRGGSNRSAVAFYDRLIDGLLASGIRPLVTLHNWDVPEPLQHVGGWLNRDTASRLADFAYLAGEAFGDRVDSWITITDPATVTLSGYGAGTDAPGAAMLLDALPAAHNQLLGHGLSVEALRAADVRGGIGIANLLAPVEPQSDRADAALAAEAADLLLGRIYSDPVLLGRYPTAPEELPDLLAAFAEVSDADLATIAAPLDFYGVNYDGPIRVRPAFAPSARSLPYALAPWPDFPHTGSGSPDASEYLTSALIDLAARYGDALPPLVVTSVGASYPDVTAPDGSTDDAARISYLAEHLAAVIAADVGVRGFFARSLLDGWEWTAGFSTPYGLLRVDREQQSRTPKRSFRWMQGLLAR